MFLKNYYEVGNTSLPTRGRESAAMRLKHFGKKLNFRRAERFVLFVRGTKQNKKLDH